MLAKLLSLILIPIVSYVLAVFVVPETADKYGNIELNTKIRTIKHKSLQYASGSESPSSLADKVIGTGKSILDEAKQTVNQTQEVITEKTEQTKRAAESAQKAYDALEQAKTDFQTLTTMSGAQPQ